MTPRFIKVILLSSLFICCFFNSAFTQNELPSFITDSLDIYSERALSEWNVPGIAVCIVKDGKVVVQKGYGFRESGKEEMVDKNTLFMIGSNTKAFTGTALAMLDQQEKCTLNDKVIDWVPNFKMKDPWVTQNANLTDILCHRMGMQTFQGDFMIFDSDFTSDEIIERFGMLTPVHEFRTDYGYFNAGYILAGMAIKNISGQSWEEFLKENLFNPLEMNRTLALSKEILTAKNKATAHTLVNGEILKIDYGMIDQVAPAGAIASSVNDMSHWLIAQLNNGIYNEKEVIPPSVIEKTRQPQSGKGKGGHPFNRSNFSLYGLGWALEDYEGFEIVSHTGGIHGFVTSVTLVPSENLGIVVLTNTDQNYLYEALKWEIIDAFLELPYRRYSTIYSNYMNQYNATQEAKYTAWQDSVDLNLQPPVAFEDFIGKYENDIYGYIEIVKMDEKLSMNFEHHPALSADLGYLSDNRFYCVFNNPLFGKSIMPFKIEDGKVKGMTLKVADFVEKTTYDFEKK